MATDRSEGIRELRPILSTDPSGDCMNYYCLYCHKRFYLEEGEGDFQSCPFCSSEDIEPDVDDEELDEEDDLDEDFDTDE